MVGVRNLDLRPFTLCETEIDLKIAMWNVESYLRWTDVKDLKFGELIERLHLLEQRRDALYFPQGSR